MPIQASETTELPESLKPAAVVWTDGDVARLTHVHAQMLRWRWPEREADSMAERLLYRDKDRDDRVSCLECRNYRPGRCSRFRRAGLSASDIGHDFAVLLQRCPAFQATARGALGLQCRADSLRTYVRS